MVTIRGSTVIYGRLLELSQSSGIIRAVDCSRNSTLVVTFAEQIYPSLADRIGGVVGLRGVADYDLSTGQIMSFSVEEVLPYRQTPPAELISELQGMAAKHGWWSGDVEELLRIVRGRDDV